MTIGSTTYSVRRKQYFYSMVTSVRQWFWGIAAILFFTSCGKKDIDLPLTIWQSEDPVTWSALSSLDGSGHFFAIGGNTWYSGAVAESRNSGQTWRVDTLGNKQLFGLTSSGETSLAVGIDGYLFEKKGETPWTFVRLSHWDILRDIVMVGEDEWIAVGGVAFNSGVIYRIKEGQITSVQPFLHELQWITRLNDQVLLSGGYGLILRSEDGGVSWKAADLEGDYFQDASFLDDQTGYLAGYAGSIWKTTNGGMSWEKLNGPRIFGALPALRAIQFRDDRTGAVCGDKGLVWFTRDGGKTWETIAGLPDDTDFHDLLFNGEQLLLCGTNGIIAVIDLP